MTSKSGPLDEPKKGSASILASFFGRAPGNSEKMMNNGTIPPKSSKPTLIALKRTPCTEPSMTTKLKWKLPSYLIKSICLELLVDLFVYL